MTIRWGATTTVPNCTVHCCAAFKTLIKCSVTSLKLALKSWAICRGSFHEWVTVRTARNAPDPRVSLRMFELVRRKLGDDVMLRIDSNQAYSLATVRQLVRPLRELNIRNWEDPVGTIEEMRELRRHCSIPFSTHNIDIARAIELRVPDAIVGSPAVHGGIGRLIRFIGACEHAAIDFWCYSGDSGIGSAAYLHLCAAIGWIREPNQSLFRMQLSDVIEGGPFSPRNNVVAVPEGPGPGLTLARDTLTACHRDYIENGPKNKYHDPAKPGTYRRWPLN